MASPTIAPSLRDFVTGFSTVCRVAKPESAKMSSTDGSPAVVPAAMPGSSSSDGVTAVAKACAALLVV